jgi:Methyltransferase domain
LRFTTVAHAGRRVLGPISDERLDAIVARLGLPDPARVMELASGKAELLIRLLTACPGARAVGIERSRWFLADALQRAADAGVADRLVLHREDATKVPWPVAEMDLAIAVGASGIVGDQLATVRLLAGMAKPGALVLFGDGVWVAEPPAAGLESFGMDRSELPDGLEAQRSLGTAAGLEPLWSQLVTVEEWDSYEGAYAAAPDAWAGEHPDDPDATAFRERAAMMRDSYTAWRREALGFGITLFRRT